MTGQIQPRTAAPLARPMMPMAAMATAQPTPTFADILRHWPSIVIWFAVGLICGTSYFIIRYYYFPRYTAVALITVQPQGVKDPTLIANQVVNKDVEFQFRSTLAAYFNNTFYAENVLNKDEIRSTNWYLKTCKGSSSSNADTDNSSGKSDDARNAEGVRKALKYMKHNIKVRADREANLIALSFEESWKDESVKIVRFIASQFVEWRKAEEKSIYIPLLRELNTQKKKIDDKLKEANNQLDNIRSGTTSIGSLGVVRFQDFMEQKLADLEIQETALKSEIARLTKEVDFLKQRAQGDYDEVVRQQIEEDPIAANLHQRLADLEVLLSGQLASFGENHRRVKETRDSRDQAKQDLARRQTELGNIVRTARMIQSNETLEARNLELKERQTQLDQGREAHRQLMADRAKYEKAETIREEWRVQLEAMNTLIGKYETLQDDPSVAKVAVGAVIAPLEPSTPLWYVNISLGIILGLTVGLGIAYLIEWRHKVLRLRTNEFRRLGVPLLGKITHKEADDEAVDADLYHVVHQAPYSMMSEDYRQFLMNLRQLESAANKKIILFTSPTAGDGKTTVAANMASILVQDGRKVLFIDANFRKPKSDKIFPIQPEGGEKKYPDFGLPNYLMGQTADPRYILRPSGIEGLDVIDGVPIPPKPANPAEMLGSPAMRKLLDTFRDSYDYILIDGPAMLVSDALTLAALAEGTIVVFNTARINKGQAERILNELKNIQATVLGSVLVGVKEVQGGYFEERYLAYQQYQKEKAKKGPGFFKGSLQGMSGIFKRKKNA